MKSVSREVIQRPLMSEKMTRLQGEGMDKSVSGDGEWFAFIVDRTADKHVIKNAVEEMFAAQKIKVTKVRTMNCRGRAARSGRNVSSPTYWKKALVQLAPGQTLNQT